MLDIIQQSSHELRKVKLNKHSDFNLGWDQGCFIQWAKLAATKGPQPCEHQ